MNRMIALEKRAQAIQIKEVLSLKIKQFESSAQNIQELENRLTKLEAPKLYLI